MPHREYVTQSWNLVTVEDPSFEELEHQPATEEPLDERMIARLSEEDREKFLCMDCGVNTLDIHEYYMIQDQLWQWVIPPHYQHHAMCIDCFEFFLGRPLVSKDFTEAPVNYVGKKSERLKDRLGSYYLDIGGPFDTPEAERQSAMRFANARNW